MITEPAWRASGERRAAPRPPLTRAERRRLHRAARLSEAAVDDDRAWFACHAGRSFRVRPASRGEELAHGAPSRGKFYTLVRQIRRGVRLRIALDLAVSPLNAEGIGRELWNWTAATARFEGGASLAELAAAMEPD